MSAMGGKRTLALNAASLQFNVRTAGFQLGTAKLRSTLARKVGQSGSKRQTHPFLPNVQQRHDCEFH
jgi:hypothetical protein